MPADTRSTRNAKHNDRGKRKEKCSPEEGSEHASGSRSSITETASKKNCTSVSPSSMRRSGRLNNGNNQPPNPSPLRKSERGKSISNSSKSDTSRSLADAKGQSLKRKKSVNELLKEADHVNQHGKTESNASSHVRKSLPARVYRDLFRARRTKVKVSDSANGRREGPCTSSNIGVCSKKIPAADEDALKEEGICGEDFAESASKDYKGALDNILPEAASETPDVLSSLDHNTNSCDVESPQDDTKSIAPLREKLCPEANGTLNILSSLDHNTNSCDVESRQDDTESITPLREKLCPVANETISILPSLDHNTNSCDVGSRQDDPESISPLGEKLCPFTVCGPKLGPSRLVEYWVPVQMSNVQLELYCSSLLTNSNALCSKSDPVGLLPEILVSTRKCCDHPFIVEEKLQARLIQGSPPAGILDIGVQASGKLYFLDTILKKIKDQGKKVIILFKTLGGSGWDIIGDVLDDYVRQRFGVDCYERVDAGGLPSRRQASVARFNKEGKFIFLLETRACSPSIKLSSVDAVIIYGSDWNPLNDLKALQKIKIDSEFEVKVFRLYTMCSIEEKVLFLSKKNIFLESNLKSLGFSTSHMLLSWGASFLFNKLDEFHNCRGDPKILPRCSDLENVGQELLSAFQTNGTHLSTKCISNARQNDGVYSTDIPLLGELYSEFNGEDQHRLLWTKLLQGRQPTWIYLSISSQRNRKRVQHIGETFETNVNIDDDIVKRQKKNENSILESCSPKVVEDVEKESVSESYGIPSTNGTELSPKSGCSTTSAQTINAANSSDKPCAEQDLHQMLKPDMERLFQILNLKEDVQQKAEQFLVYIIAKQRVIREPDQLQAFLISVCWVAASILKENLDHVESLSLARKHLNFNCKIDDAEFSFSKMQFPMKMFLRSEGAKLQGFSKDLASGTGGFNVSNCKQTSEEKELKTLWHDSKAKLEKNFKMESSIISSLNSDEKVRADKLKILEDNYRKKLEELESAIGKAKHNEERKAKAKEGILKMNDLKSCEENGLLAKLPTKAAEGIPAKSFSSLGMEQHDEASNCAHLESMNSPSTMNPSVAVHVSQDHATSHARLNPLNTEDVRAEMPDHHSSDMPCNTSEQAVPVHLPPHSTPVDSAVSHPVELTQPCPTSSGIPNISLTEPSIHCITPDAPILEDHRHLNRSVDAYPPLHTSNQFQTFMPRRSFPRNPPAPQELFDPLRTEYERICGESNQVTKSHEDTVLHLNSECDKEIKELVSQITRKYESMVHEAETSFLQKQSELERYQLKLAMNIKLAEAFRTKCMDHSTTPHRGFNPVMTNSSTLPSVAPNYAATRPAAPALAPAPAPVQLQPLPEIARNFEAWNMNEFEGYLDVRGQQQQQLLQQQLERLIRPTGFVCPSDDE